MKHKKDIKFESVAEIPHVTTQIKTTEQYFKIQPGLQANSFSKSLFGDHLV